MASWWTWCIPSLAFAYFIAVVGTNKLCKSFWCRSWGQCVCSEELQLRVELVLTISFFCIRCGDWAILTAGGLCVSCCDLTRLTQFVETNPHRIHGEQYCLDWVPHARAIWVDLLSKWEQTANVDWMLLQQERNEMDGDQKESHVQNIFKRKFLCQGKSANRGYRGYKIRPSVKTLDC